MKIHFSKIIFLLFVFNAVHTTAQNPFWTDGTAFTVSEKQLEVSLFRPSKFGLTKRDEISANPVGIFVLPHVFYKRRWVKFALFERKFLVSSKHGLYYPRPALKLNDKLNFRFSEYTPSDSPIPVTIAIQNEIIVSHFLNEPSHCSPGDYLLTLRLGFKYAFKFSSYEHPLINQSILFRETLVLLPGFVWYTGIDIDGHMNRMFNYFGGLDYYAHGFIKHWSVEAKGGLMGYSGRKLSGFAGLKIGFSVIPDKNRFLIMPIAGLSYVLDMRTKTKHGKELFRNGVFKHDNSLERDDKYYEDAEKREALKDSIQ